MGRSLAALLLGSMLIGHCLAAPAPKALPKEKVAALIKQLAAAKFKTRENAQKALMECDRSALAVLGGFINDDDPEIRERVRAIAKHIRTNPAAIPQNYWVFTTQNQYDGEAWKTLSKPWNDQAKVAVENIKSEGTRAGAFAQSFVPKCEKIAAVQLMLSPNGDTRGWIRIDIRADGKNNPSKEVLARAWVRIDKPPFTFKDFVTINLPDTRVDPKARYWITLSTGLDKNIANRPLVNYGYSKNSAYADGGLMQVSRTRSFGRRGMIQPSATVSPSLDACFRIISEAKAKEVPLMRAATDADKKTLPESDSMSDPLGLGSSTNGGTSHIRPMPAQVFFR
jgi:hypothetical protein